MRQSRVFAVSFLGVLIAAIGATPGGCGHTVYDVDMTVEGNEVTRTISIGHTDGNRRGIFTVAVQDLDPNSAAAQAKTSHAPASDNHDNATSHATDSSQTRAATKPSERDTIAAIYKVDPNIAQPWKRTFSGRTPNDVGGAGEVGFYQSDMGGAWIYIERFRGDADPAGTLQERLKSARTLASIVAGWARARLGGRKGFDKLGDYLDGDFPKDLQNLSLLTWTFGAVREMSTGQARSPSTQPMERPTKVEELVATLGMSSGQIDVAAMMAQYLIERRYIAIEDAPAAMRALSASSTDDQNAAIKRLWRSFLTQKLNLSDTDLINHLASMFDRSEEVGQSFMKYVEDHEAYREHVRRPADPNHSADRAASNPIDGDATPSGFVNLLIAKSFTPPGLNVLVLVMKDELRLALALPEAPVFTNGLWDANEGKVSWNTRIDGPLPDPLPSICFAVWARPDEHSQKTRLGGVVLTGESLVKYCLWYAGLTGEEKQQWDAFMAAMKPDTATTQIAAMQAQWATQPATSQPAATNPAAQDKAYINTGLEIIGGAIK